MSAVPHLNFERRDIALPQLGRCSGDQKSAHGAEADTKSNDQHATRGTRYRKASIVQSNRALTEWGCTYGTCRHPSVAKGLPLERSLLSINAVRSRISRCQLGTRPVWPITGSGGTANMLNALGGKAKCPTQVRRSFCNNDLRA